MNSTPESEDDSVLSPSEVIERSPVRRRSFSPRYGAPRERPVERPVILPHRTFQRAAPAAHHYIRRNLDLPTFSTSETKFWFNIQHDNFLKRLRTRDRFSFLRVIYMAFLSLHVAYDDLSVWTRLYGLPGGIAVAAFAKKSIWVLQTEVLLSFLDEFRWQPYRGKKPEDSAEEPSSPRRSRDSIHRNSADRGPAGNHDRPDGRPGSPPDDPSSIYEGDGELGATPSPKLSVAGLEFKKAVQDESARIGTSGGIITAVAMAALVLPNVSQTHWIVQSCWTSSMVTALLAVFFSNDQAWTISQLTSEQKLRAWIKDVDPGEERSGSILTSYPQEDVNVTDVMIDNLVPAPSSAIKVSAPSLLLSSSLLLLLSGMGMFLAFTWKRHPDPDVSVSSSRDVFIVYIVTLGASLGTLGFFSLGRVAVPIRQSIVRSIRVFIRRVVDASNRAQAQRESISDEVFAVPERIYVPDGQEVIERESPILRPWRAARSQVSFPDDRSMAPGERGSMDAERRSPVSEANGSEKQEIGASEIEVQESETGEGVMKEPQDKEDGGSKKTE